jgi:hypothetical protein
MIGTKMWFAVLNQASPEVSVSTLYIAALTEMEKLLFGQDFTPKATNISG